MSLQITERAFMNLTDFLSGSPTRITPTTLLNPMQQSAQKFALGAAQKGINQAFDFAPIATAAQNRFQQQTMPSIAERFAGLGAQRGSAFNQATANAQRDLQLDLAGQNQQFNLASQRNWADILGQGLKPSIENIVEQGRPAGVLDLIKTLGPILARVYLASQTAGGSEVANTVANTTTGGSWFDWLKGLFGGGAGASQAAANTGGNMLENIIAARGNSDTLYPRF